MTFLTQFTLGDLIAVAALTFGPLGFVWWRVGR